MHKRDEAEAGQQKGTTLKERLRGVRKRKQGWQAGDCVDQFACRVVAYKMKLTESRHAGGNGS